MKKSQLLFFGHIHELFQLCNLCLFRIEIDAIFPLILFFLGQLRYQLIDQTVNWQCSDWRLDDLVTTDRTLLNKEIIRSAELHEANNRAVPFSWWATSLSNLCRSCASTPTCVYWVTSPDKCYTWSPLQFQIVAVFLLASSCLWSFWLNSWYRRWTSTSRPFHGMNTLYCQVHRQISLFHAPITTL